MIWFPGKKKKARAFGAPEPFLCTELTPWQPGLTRKGTPIVHTEALEYRRTKVLGSIQVAKRCPVCLAEWVQELR